MSLEKVIKAIQPSQTDYGVDQKLLGWCQYQLKGFVSLTNSQSIRLTNSTDELT